jgi:hypothetical protein
MSKQYIALSFNCHSFVFATYLLPFPLDNQQRSTTDRPFFCCSFFPSANTTSRKRPCRPCVHIRLYNIYRSTTYLPLGHKTHTKDVLKMYVCTNRSTLYFTLQDEWRPGVRSKIRRLHVSWLTNSALVYEPICGGWSGWRGFEEPADEYSCTHRAQINFGDLTPYLTYGHIAHSF